MLKKLSAMILIASTVTTTAVLAEVSKPDNIRFISPWTNTGSSHAIGQKQSELLAEKGWVLNDGDGYQSLGNCLKALDIVEKSDEPVIYIWESMYHTDDKSYECYQEPVKQENVVSLWYSFTDYVCRADDDLLPVDQASGSIRVGVSAAYDFTEEKENILRNITDADVNLIRYENWPSILSAAKVGEVDYVWSGLAPGEQTEGTLFCDYNTTGSEVLGTQSISDTFDNIDYEFSGVVYLVAKGLDQATIEEFKNDWYATIESDEISTIFERKSWISPSEHVGVESREDIYQLILDKH